MDYDLRQTTRKYNTTKQASLIPLVNSMSEAKRIRRRIWPKLTRGTVEHAKGNDGWEVIITQGKKRNLRELSHIKGERGDIWEDVPLWHFEDIILILFGIFGSRERPIEVFPRKRARRERKREDWRIACIETC